MIKLAVPMKLGEVAIISNILPTFSAGIVAFLYRKALSFVCYILRLCENVSAQLLVTRIVVSIFS